MSFSETADNRSVITRLLHRAIKETKLETLDRVLGSLLGALKMAALVACILGVMAAIDLEIFRDWFDKATLARPFARGTDVLVALIPQDYRDHANEGIREAREQIQQKITDAAVDALKGEKK